MKVPETHRINASEFHRRARRFIDESEEEIGTRKAWYYALKLAEERGEAIKAYNRYSGLARKRGTLPEVAAELCDTIFSAFILAEKLGIDLGDYFDATYENVMTRGFRE